MKQLFRCEYCTEVGTEEEIRAHEEGCLWNYTKKSCWTCKHAEKVLSKIRCTADKEISDGTYIEQCSSYEYDGKDHARSLKSPFGSSFWPF